MGTKKKATLIKFNRENIIATAKRLFEMNGIAQTTMDDIAREADYSKSTIYVYFKSKEDIYNHILCEHMVILKERLNECVSNTEDFEQGYYKICESLVNFNEEYPLYYSSLLGELTASADKMRSDSVLSEIYKVGEEINKIILAFLKSAFEKKIIREDLPLLPTVFYVWSGISGIIQMASNKREYLEARLGMDHENYLKFAFESFYNSISRESTQ